MKLFATPPVSLETAPSKRVDVLIVGMTETEKKTAIVGGESIAKKITSKFPAALPELATQVGASAKVGSVVCLPALEGMQLMVVGLGDGTPEDVRKAAGSALRAARGKGSEKPVTVAVDLGVTEPELLQAAAEGALMGLYEFAKLTAERAEVPVKAVEIISTEKGKDAKAAVEAAQIIAEGVNTAREWVNLPANYLYPETFAASAADEAKKYGIKVDVMDDKELEKKGFGGIMTVGRGSEHKPRLARLEYAPKGATFHLALVGKGMTFDTGGLNLKPADGMYTMKCDMGGAAAVLGATLAIARLGLKIKVTCYAAMAENTPSSTAYRPSDVLTMYGGKTVENANSDAEGRLVMADAIVRASEDKPDMIIDCATLTGACIVGLGNLYAGVMSTEQESADRILDAAESCDELFWQLPLHASQLEALKSDVADLKSSGIRMGGAMMAATFLHEFVGEGIDWAHLDIAGPAFNSGSASGYTPVGGTGSGVRTLVSLARSLQA